MFRVRVLGEFPTQSDDVLLPLRLVEDATHRDVEGGSRPAEITSGAGRGALRLRPLDAREAAREMC